MTRFVDIWYPKVDLDHRDQAEATEINIALIDVRAANELIVTFSHERDGYVLFMEYEEDGNGAPGKRVEVGFVPSWAGEPEDGVF